MSDEKEDAKVIEFLEEPLDQTTKEGEKKLYFKRSASDFRVSDYQIYDQNHETVKTRSLIVEAVLGFNILLQTEDQKTENLAQLEKRIQEYEKTFKEAFSNYPVHVRLSKKFFDVFILSLLKKCKKFLFKLSQEIIQFQQVMVRQMLAVYVLQLLQIQEQQMLVVKELLYLIIQVQILHKLME
ncbi:hypothetical protein RFI_04947 [Reticulomyxa filosa]|uniref:Uncharacterized protein n=1 Tax=Reticulomyxa filosa TaxID=46433 RepID=X6P210_RETFI|nr:hypothetical protein RFI_04947 [Reticulomyxa filosa]|eukprot:ETO32173.1 hypothetical protein RFI_04947 [Reticulomyxa filosa]